MYNMICSPRCCSEWMLLFKSRFPQKKNAYRICANIPARNATYGLFKFFSRSQLSDCLTRKKGELNSEARYPVFMSINVNFWMNVCAAIFCPFCQNIPVYLYCAVWNSQQVQCDAICYHKLKSQLRPTSLDFPQSSFRWLLDCMKPTLRMLRNTTSRTWMEHEHWWKGQFVYTTHDLTSVATWPSTRLSKERARHCMTYAALINLLNCPVDHD